MKLKKWIKSLVFIIVSFSASVATAGVVNTGLTGYPGLSATLTQGDTLALSFSTSFSPNNYNYHYYPQYYFPFCGCYISVNGWGTSSGRQSYGDFYNQNTDTAFKTLLTASDDDGHFSQVTSDNGTASGSLSWMFATAGTYNINISSQTGYQASYASRSCGGSAWGNRGLFGTDAWCDFGVLSTSSGSNNYTAFGQTVNFIVNVEPLQSTVPEPASLALVSVALLGLAASRKRSS